ncbi:MAG: M36 family metallopeptidase [Myxococcota bacterium]
MRATRSWRSQRRRTAATRWCFAGIMATGVGLHAGVVGAAGPTDDGPTALRPADLRVANVQALPLSADLAGGTVERRELSMDGLLVRGAYEVVRTDPGGHTEMMSSRYPSATPQLRPADARIDAVAVPGLIAASRAMGDEPQLEEPPQLVYLMMLGQPVLAWEAQAELTLFPEPSRRTYWISAATGRVLEEVEQVRTSRARIFAENPSITPEPIELELIDLDVDEAGHPLVGDRVQAFNCLGVETAEVSPWWDENECWPLQTVFSDENGDFFVDLPDVVQIEDNIDGQDRYAELSMYVHSEIFLATMRDNGVEEFKCEFASMLANVRTFEDGAPDYSPLNNAFYTNQCDPERGPTMMFGQGSEVDFGYDADVIYHELGHGMVALLAPEGLSGRRLRSDGSLVDASGMNEALADYFSVMVTDDPHLADYVGRFWSATGRPFIRDAENDKTCPNDTVGQVHNDGEPFMAALWATRKRLDDDGVRALDRAVIEALMRMAPDSSLEEGAALVIEMAERAQLEGGLDSDAVDLLRRSFDARGLIDCPRVITDPREVRDGRSIYLRRMDAAVHPFYPGPMQLRYEVPADADDMVMTFALRPRGSSDPVEATVLVKHGDEPISYEYQLVSVDDPPLEPPEEGEDPGDPVRELVLVTGDWDVELTPFEVTESDYIVELGGLEPGEVVHVALANISPTEAIASSFMIRSSTELPSDDEGTGTDGGSETGVPAAVDEVDAEIGQASCACRGSGSVPAGAWWAALPLLALRRRRRA